MSAPALGLACRFRGLDVVKALVEKGATFDFPSTKKQKKDIIVILEKSMGIIAQIMQCICSKSLEKF